MRLLLRTYYTGSFDDPCALTHVVVDIDPRHQLDMRANLSIVLSLPQIYSVTFFDYTPRPVQCDFLDEPPEWLDEDAGVLAIPDDVTPPETEFRMSALTIRYMPDGIMWHFYEQHGGDPYETVSIPWSFIESAAKQPGGASAKISH